MLYNSITFKRRIIGVSAFFFSIILISTGCHKHKQYKAVKAIIKATNFTLDTTICEIKIDSNQSYVYKIYAVSDKGLFCGYNHKKKAFDLFDLTRKCVLKSIPINDFGPNQLKNIESLYIQSKDSIFVLTGKFVKLLDSSGNVKTSIPIDSKISNSLYKENDFTNSSVFNNFLYVRNRNILIFQNNNIKYGSCKPQHYEQGSPVGIVNLSNGTPSLLNMSFSDLYANGYYGYFGEPVLSVLNNGKIAVGYPIEPVVYVYDIDSNKVISRKSTFPDNQCFFAKKLKWDLCNEDDLEVQHFIESPIYCNLLSDKWNHLYYRFQMGPVVYKPMNKTGRYPGLNDKLVSLSILDDSLNVLSCIKLPDKRIWPPTAFVLNNGIYVPAAKGENNLRFKVFKLKKITNTNETASLNH